MGLEKIGSEIEEKTSWNTINGQIHVHELREQYPHIDLELLDLFEDLVDSS